jgi:RNA polymerase sigma-70 factor (ECF subfamily)
MTEAEITELIKLAQNGDEHAFSSLIEEHYGMMFKMAFKWCGNREDAEDITQNACIKLARNIDKFEFKSAFSSWLYRLVINTGKDWIKSDARHKSGNVAESDNVPTEETSADKQLYAKELLLQVYKLPENEKTALLLVMSEGLTHKETAVIMDCKESTVSWYIHEARKKLDNFKEKERKHG